MKEKLKIHLSFFYVLRIVGISKEVLRHFYGILINDDLRAKFCICRFNNFKIKSYKNNSNLIKNTISHNLTAFEHFYNDFKMQRSKRLIFSILADESINFNSKFLIIGPRTENEIIFLKVLGYHNVEAIDLISYSDLVTCGDMHSIPFPDKSFDAVVCGWTLSYSAKPSLALKEMFRKCKPGGVIGIGIEHADKKTKISTRQLKDPRLINQKPSSRKVNTIKDILRLVPKNNVKTINYRYDSELKCHSPSDLFEKTGLHSSQVMITLKKR